MAELAIEAQPTGRQSRASAAWQELNVCLHVVDVIFVMMLAFAGVVRRCRTPVLAVRCRSNFQIGSQAGRNAGISGDSSCVDWRSACFPGVAVAR